MAQDIGAPATPRDDVSFSELIPLGSKKVSFLRSRALIPLVFTAVMCLLLYSTLDEIDKPKDTLKYMAYLAYFISGVIFMMIYYYTGERKNILWYALPAGFTYWQMYNTFYYYAVFFRDVLPGDIEHASPSFLSQFRAFFFAAGLTEETLKAVPIVIALLVALYLRRNPNASNPVTRGLALEGPIDGLLMGVAAGIAFTLFETLGQYVPETISEVRRQSNNEAFGHLFGLMLLLPRVADGVIGHSAYAGIFGYFAGLAVSHPRATWKLLPIGLLAAAIPHTLWDSLGSLVPAPYSGWMAGALTLALFFGCLLKGKQLEVSRLGGPVDGRSVLAVSPPPGTLAPGPAGIVPPEAPGVAGVFTRIASALERAVGFKATTTVSTPGAPAIPPPVPAHGLSIGTGEERYALAPNAPVDFSALFPGIPVGCTGLIGASEVGRLEIANTGASSWMASLPDGTSLSVPPGSRLEAQPGATLRIGSATITIEAF